MNEYEKQRVVGELAKLVAIFPKHPLTRDTVEVYAQALASVDPLTLEAAISHLVTTARFFPKPSEILDAVFDLEARAAGLPDPEQAWELVDRELMNGRGHPIVGRDLESNLPSSIEQAVRAVGGWRYLCESENLTADRARFVDAYRAALRRQSEDRRMLPPVHREIRRLSGKLRADRALPGGSDE